MKTARLMFRLVCLVVFFAALVEIVWMGRANSAEVTAEGEKPSAESGAAPEATKSPGGAGAEKNQTAEVVANGLETKRLALDSREHDLDEREQRLKDREKDIDKKLKDLEQLRLAVSGALDEQRKGSEDRVRKLVTVFETMTPKSSAAVFETLDDWLAVEALKRMDTTKVAKIMNIMDKTRSARLSEMLTGYYHPESDRKISSVKSAGGQVVAAAPNGARAAAPAQNAPTSPLSPQNPTKRGGDK